MNNQYLLELEDELFQFREELDDRMGIGAIGVEPRDLFLREQISKLESEIYELQRMMHHEGRY